MELYIHETERENAPSIVFLHGIGAGGWMWRRQITALADCHCIALDLPGHGKSSGVSWTSLADVSDQIATLIQTHAHNQRAHVVGLSLGGHIALELLARHSHHLQHVVISGVTVEPWPNRVFLKPQLGLITTLLKQPWYRQQIIKSMRVPPDMQADALASLQAVSIPAYRQIYQEGAEWSVSPSLATINNPTLVTAGSLETKIIRQAVHALVDLMPHAQGCFAPRCHHGWNIEAPELFSTMIRAWVNTEPLPSPLQIVKGA